MAKGISYTLKRPQKQPGQVCFVVVLRAVHLPLCILYNIAHFNAILYKNKVEATCSNRLPFIGLAFN